MEYLDLDLDEYIAKIDTLVEDYKATINKNMKTGEDYVIRHIRNQCVEILENGELNRYDNIDRHSCSLYSGSGFKERNDEWEADLERMRSNDEIYQESRHRAHEDAISSRHRFY